MNSKIVIGVVIGLVIGLLLGIFVIPIFNLLSIFNKGVGTNNQVQVSGTIQEENPIEISFSSIYGSSQTIRTSTIITNGQYNVVLVGNQSYSVTVSYTNSYGFTQDAYYSIYVPSGVTTFTANF